MQVPFDLQLDTLPDESGMVLILEWNPNHPKYKTYKEFQANQIHAMITQALQEMLVSDPSSS